MTESQLKAQILIMAGYQLEGEALTSRDEKQKLSELVVRICADNGTTHVCTALIAATLAHAFEDKQ